MNPIRMAAVSTVTLALLFYTLGTLREQATHRATRGARGYLTAGVACDILATALMVLATGSFAATLHGWLGYSALALMLADVVLLWRHWRREGEAVLPASLHFYARFAYGYWVIAYFTGAALVMASRRAGGH